MNAIARWRQKIPFVDQIKIVRMSGYLMRCRSRKRVTVVLSSFIGQMGSKIFNINYRITAASYLY